MIISINNTIITHTYQDRSPYVYEIRHKETGKLYIGVRFAKNCHHTELLEPNGYHTSSDIVTKIIKDEGLSSFEITYIEEFNDIKDAQTKEIGLQRLVEAHKNKLYINKAISCCIVQTIEIQNKIKDTNMERYGYAYGLQSKDIQLKTKQTNLERYGHENIAQSEYGKNKIKETNLAKFGVEYASQSEEIKEKMRKTNLERYGVEHSMQSELIKNKQTNTLFELYGVYNISNIPKCIEKKKQTSLINYNCLYPMQSKEVKEKVKNTMIELYGVENYSQTDDARERASTNMKNINCIKVQCDKCGYISSLGDITQYHNEKCRKIGQYRNGVLINEYKSLVFLKDYGFNPSQVSACCRGKAKSYKGFQWKYL